MKKVLKKIIGIITSISCCVVLGVPVYAQSDDFSIKEKNSIERIMPTHKVIYGSFTATNGLGSAQIKVAVDLLYDSQGANIMSVNSITAYPEGPTVNFESWETLNTSYTRIGGRALTVTVTGRLTTAGSTPIGVSVREVSDVTQAVNIAVE